MKHTLFIADLHLDEQHTHTTRLFKEFMTTKAIHADALYILGDFFELWIGDDEQTPFQQEIQGMLRDLTQQGIPVYFLPGNRDFLVGKTFARRTGCQLLPETKLIELYGERILLQHGDGLCTADARHIKFRKLTHNRLVQQFVLMFPLKTRKKIGLKLRSNSKQHLDYNDATAQMDVAPSAVHAAFERSGASYLIHGHTHHPKIESTQVNGKPAHRIVLGCWESEGSMLRWDESGQHELLSFSLSK